MKLVRTFICPAILATLVLATTCAPASAYNLGRDVTFPNAWMILARSNRAMNHVGTAHGVGLSKLTTKVKTSKGLETVMDEGVFIGDATTNLAGSTGVCWLPGPRRQGWAGSGVALAGGRHSSEQTSPPHISDHRSVRDCGRWALRLAQVCGGE